MRKLFHFLLAISLLAACPGRQPQVDKIVENGVEVVLNHIKPYRVPNEPSELRLEKEFAIDAEDPGLLKAGLTDIYRFGIGSDGSVYVAQRARKDAFVIFKFDERGRPRSSFGRVGQGPGEIEICSYFGVVGPDEIYVLDAQKNKVTTFAPSGELLMEKSLPRSSVGAIPLENGNFLAPGSEVSPSADQEEITFNLLDRQFALVKVMQRYRFPIRYPGAAKVNAYLTNPAGSFDSGRIYLGLPGRDYEVLVFDLEGDLLRKIRKEYKPVVVTAGFREDVLARLPKGSPMAERLEFPDHKPSFQYMFADEKGRLFVTTSEIDEASGQNICDVFNASGVFICRAAVGYFDLLRVFWEGVTLDVKAKNGRLYVLHEKEDGYKELVVYKAIWR